MSVCAYEKGRHVLEASAIAGVGETYAEEPEVGSEGADEDQKCRVTFPSLRVHHISTSLILLPCLFTTPPSSSQGPVLPLETTYIQHEETFEDSVT
jgi:hypothetical protein